MTTGIDDADDVAESVWPRSMERLPGAVPLTLGTVATITGLTAGFVSPTWMWLKASFYVLAIVSGLTTLPIALAREHRRDKIEAALNHRRVKAAEEHESVIDQKLSPVLQLVAELLSTKDHQQRLTTCGQVHSAIVVAATTMVGGAASVRAHMFEMKELPDGRACMRPTLFWGRGLKSHREFHETDPTMIKTRAGEYRFISGVSADEGLAYQTYLTHPITDGAVTYGVLTIDALQNGELNEERDVPIARILATIAAIASAAVSQPTASK